MLTLIHLTYGIPFCIGVQTVISNYLFIYLCTKGVYYLYNEKKKKKGKNENLTRSLNTFDFSPYYNKDRKRHLKKFICVGRKDTVYSLYISCEPKRNPGRHLFIRYEFCSDDPIIILPLITQLFCANMYFCKIGRSLNYVTL